MTLEARDLVVPGRLGPVSAQLGAGEITAICGPNGAGKSTLLQCLAGLLRPQSGAVSIDGEELARLHPRTRAQRIGYLAQNGDIAWDVSVRNLAALGRLPHRDEGAAAVERAITALGLEQLADRPVSQLSGGEKARALLARVFAGEPDWILADEPLAALDLAHQLALLRHLRSAASSGKGVVLVVHDLALAMNHADRVLVLGEGHVKADGPPEQALSSEVLDEVWGVSAQWIAEGRNRALIVR